MDPELGIVIPAFNERDRLPATLAEIIRTLDRPTDAAAGWRPASFEIVVVDDGSTDDTAGAVAAFDDPRVSCLRLPSNRGKGAAVRTGLQATTADWVLIFDADSSTGISEVGRLMEVARTTGAEIVVGSRADADSRIGRHQPRRRELLGQTYNRLLRGLGLTTLYDTQCGFKLLRGDTARSLAPSLTIDGFAFDVELLWLAQRAGVTPVSVGVRWDHDEKTHVRTLSHGSRMVVDAFRTRWPSLARHGVRIAAAALLAVTLLLQVWAIHSHSLTGDGSYHLVAGHQALRYGTNTVNLEHPPLAKLAMSLPTLLWEPLAPPIEIGEAVDTAVRLSERPALMQRATIAGRYVMLVLFILPLYLACVRLGARWGGQRAGVLLGAMVLLSFPVVGTLYILQTDAAVALGFLLTLLAAMHFVEAPAPLAAAALGGSLGLAMAVKFSGALLGPTVLLALAIGMWRHRVSTSAAEGTTREMPVGMPRAIWMLLPLITFAATALVLEGSFQLANLRYDSELGRAAIQAYVEGEGLITGSALRPMGPPLLALERYDVGMSQWLTGFFAVRAQNQIGVYPSYAFGVLTSAGRWWYHPVVFLLKTPLAILLAAIALAVGWLRRPSPGSSPAAASADATPSPSGAWVALIGLTVLVYLAVAISSNYNLGYRHLMPIVPFLYLPVAVGLGRRPLAGLVLLVVLVVECLAVAPLWASATNTWWLGDSNPVRFALGNGNLSKSLVLLDRSVKQRELSGLGVVDPMLQPEALAAYVNEARSVQPGDEITPGWYAVAVVVEQFVPALLRDVDAEGPDSEPPYLLFRDALMDEALRWTPVWREVVRRGEDHGYIAGTYHLYRVAPAPGPRLP